jgi:P27 family predicted phage terminase small subunit
MGKRGPAPVPTNLRLLHGETRPSRINRDEPKPRELSPPKPEWLSSAAAEEWDRVIPDVIAMRSARAVDASALAAYCEAVARFRTASQVVAVAGLMIKDRDGSLRRNPAVSQARDASAEMRSWAREFGFTPAARQPLRIEHSVGAGLAAERLLS